MQINIIIPNYVYYKIVKLTPRYEYPTTLIFQKTQVRYIGSCRLSNLCKIFHIF
jgi:hypothetical protein